MQFFDGGKYFCIAVTEFFGVGVFSLTFNLRADFFEDIVGGDVRNHSERVRFNRRF